MGTSGITRTTVMIESLLRNTLHGKLGCKVMAALLEKSQLNDIYQDMLARLEMGLLSNEDGEIAADEFGEQLREAILEKMPADYGGEHRKIDVFSVAFGAISERILRPHYENNGRTWW